jgi:hypothetical protein
MIHEYLQKFIIDNLRQNLNIKVIKLPGACVPEVKDREIVLATLKNEELITVYWLATTDLKYCIKMQVSLVDKELESNPTTVNLLEHEIETNALRLLRVSGML